MINLYKNDTFTEKFLIMALAEYQSVDDLVYTPIRDEYTGISDFPIRTLSVTDINNDAVVVSQQVISENIPTPTSVLTPTLVSDEPVTPIRTPIDDEYGYTGGEAGLPPDGLPCRGGVFRNGVCVGYEPPTPTPRPPIGGVPTPQEGGPCETRIDGKIVAGIFRSGDSGFICVPNQTGNQQPQQQPKKKITNNLSTIVVGLGIVVGLIVVFKIFKKNPTT